MRALWLGLLLVAAFALCAAYDLIGRAILADNQIFFFLSERAAEGVPPHISMADPKTQLNALVTAAVMAVTGLAGLDDLMVFRAVSVLSVLLSMWLAWRLAIELSGQVLAGQVLAGVITGAAMLTVDGLFLEGASGGRPHVFVVTGLLAAHLLQARRRDFAAGFAAACTFLCWQPSGIVLGSIGLSMLLSRREPLRRAVRVGLGALLAAALYEAYFVAHGVAGEQLFQEFVLPTGSVHVVESWWENFWFVVTDARSHRSLPRLLPAGFLLILALGWLAALARPRAAFELVRTRPELTSLWLAAHLGFAFTVYEHQAHPDLLLVQPYYALACGWATSQLMLLGPLSRPRMVATWIVALVLVGWGYNEGRIAARMLSPGAPYGLAEQKEVADALEVYADHRRGLWVYGPVHLLALLERDNWTGHAFVWDDLKRHMDTDSYRPLRDGKMPEIIVTGRGIVPGQTHWRRVEYEEITPPRFVLHNLRVFARRLDADAVGAEYEAKQKARAALGR